MHLRSSAITIGLLAALYFGAAKFGLTMAFTAEQVTLVWPPSGLALAALLVLGVPVWPGLLIGAFLANVTSHEPVIVVLAIAGGNTAEAVAAVWLMRHYVQIGDAVETLRHALALVVAGAFVSTMISATIGMTSLCLGGVQPWSAFGGLWWTWWLGDATGDLLIAPVLLTWRAWKTLRRDARGMEAALVAVSLVVTSVGVFDRHLTAGAAAQYGLEYTVFPCLIWAAIRFGAPGAALANLLTAGFAVWGTVHGAGPYASGDVADHLRLLQIFMSVAAATGLLLGSAISEQAAAARRRAAENAVTHVLAYAENEQHATSRIIDVINKDLDWDIGLLWYVDPDIKLMRNADVRKRFGLTFLEFERVSRPRTFTSGGILPGYPWSPNEPPSVE